PGPSHTNSPTEPPSAVLLPIRRPRRARRGNTESGCRPAREPVGGPADRSHTCRDLGGIRLAAGLRHLFARRPQAANGSSAGVNDVAAGNRGRLVMAALG